jgi:hypothetical protein
VAVEEAFRERPQSGALAVGHAARAELLRVDCQQPLRRRHAAAEPLLQTRNDRSCRADRQLVADNLNCLRLQGHSFSSLSVSTISLSVHWPFVSFRSVRVAF